MIIIRGWDAAENRMVYDLGDMVGSTLNHYLLSQEADSTIVIMREGDGVILPTMRATGLLDVNGIPIYEGDKVTHNNGDTYTVQWNQLHCGWGLFLDGGMWMELDADWITDKGESPTQWENTSLEVIGHIYER